MNFYKMIDFQNFKITKITVLLLFSLFSFGNIYACDLCSCTTTGGSSSFGDLSMSNFTGLRYIHQNYESRDGIFSNSPISKERFNTYQLWGRVPICESFFVTAVIPFQDLNREFEDRNEHISGLGDINFMTWYQIKLYKKRADDEVDFNTERERSNHMLNVGLGIKLPTGEFEERLTDKVNPGFQVGTGSLDVFPSIMYGYSKNNFGVVANLSYYFKSKNKNDYKFGDQFSYGSSAFYNIELKKVTVKPFLGFSGDIYDSIEQYGEQLQDTNGSIFNGSIGSEFNRDDFLLGIKYTLPIHQDLFDGNVESQQQFSVYLNYAL
ncbi:transporter family protein [Psychroserpens damuponensis]|uniref:hypothetical protein n=1 Tax=Psychroserpens damuponensis TaxID=943936 RepID=UPI00058F8F93|nr:hypothetical protein [Psychroserpens damuponensis]